MDFKQRILWRVNPRSTRTEETDRKFRDFSASLGYRPDPSGYCSLDLDDENAEKVLEAIGKFCGTNDWIADIAYQRDLVVKDSEWYQIKAKFFFDDESDWQTDVIKKGLFGKRLSQIYAYRIGGNGPRRDQDYVYVPDSFRLFCLKQGYDDVRFCHLTDAGVYAGEQYFVIIPENRVKRIMHVDRNTNRLLFGISNAGVDTLGGKLPELARIVNVRLGVKCSSAFLSSDMPDGNFAIGYDLWPRMTKILVRKNAADNMLKAGVISRDQLEPAAVVDEPLPAYDLTRCPIVFFPDRKTCQQRMQAYEQIVNKERPEKRIDDYSAVELLGKLKGTDHGRFSEGLRDDIRKEIEQSPYAPLLKYYQFSDGFTIHDDDLKIYGFREALKKNAEMLERINEERLPDADGVLIGETLGMDYIILTDSGEVHILDGGDELFSLFSWSNMAHFICDEAEWGAGGVI